MNDLDTALAALLVAGEREPDEAFVLRVSRQVAAEERLRAVRQSAWRKFGMEVVGTSAALAAFILLSRLGAPGPEGAEIGLFSPALVAIMLVALWVVAGTRPDTSRSR
jgi:hypothetical protein